MQTERVEVSRDEASALLRKYKEHRFHSNPVDAEIVRVANMVAKGRKIVRALASIVKAGVDNAGLPKLAIMRADQPWCYLDLRPSGSAVMHNRETWAGPRMAASLRFDFPDGTFPARSGKFQQRHKAMVPHIPPDIRPKRGIQNYHILWEAEWTADVPVDPMLLRRVGNSGDLWLVLGMWDLTPIERAVLAGLVK